LVEMTTITSSRACREISIIKKVTVSNNGDFSASVEMTRGLVEMTSRDRNDEGGEDFSMEPVLSLSNAGWNDERVD